MSLSLANKYRPQDFDHLIGQDHIASILKYQATHHTRQANYLFFWPRGTGKTSSARLFAKAINCTNLRDGNPCNECENCKAITNNTTMDIMEIDAASHTGVDNIREEIIDKVGYRPTLLSKKIIIIDEVHMLSKWAFNALLKTMEEPREWMIFILATTELNKVPETIISRCQVFNFKKVPAPLLIANLRTITEAENIKATDEGLAMIAKLSDGCVRDANKYLDQISVMWEVTVDTVWQFLGVVSDQMIHDLLEKLKIFQHSNSSEDFAIVIAQVEELATKGVDLSIFPKQLMHYADEHFSSDPNFFSSVSKLASELISQSKRYPHPLLLYKTILWNQGRIVNEIYNINHLTLVPSPLREGWPSLTGGNQQDRAHLQAPKERNGEGLGWGISQIPTLSPDQFTNLLTPSLQNILHDKCEIESLDGPIAKIFVINLNAMSKTMLTKKESNDLMISTLHTLWYPHIKAIEWKGITKEEYVMMKLH